MKLVVHSSISFHHSSMTVNPIVVLLEFGIFMKQQMTLYFVLLLCLFPLVADKLQAKISSDESISMI